MDLGVLIPLTLIGFVGLGLLWYRVIAPIVESMRPADAETLHYQTPAPAAEAPAAAKPAPPAPVADDLGARLRASHTRAAALDVLLLAGWDTTEIRDLLRGDNNAKVEEIEAARKRLGMPPPARPLLVKREDGYEDIGRAPARPVVIAYDDPALNYAEPPQP